MTLPIQAATPLSLRDVSNSMPTRVAMFNNDIELSVFIEKLNISTNPEDLHSPHSISLNTRFKNISSIAIVLKKPIVYGFASPTRPTNAPNDLTILVQQQNGKYVDLATWANYYFDRRQKKNPPNATPNDFIDLKPGETFSFSVNLALPTAHFVETGYDGNLPAGNYRLLVIYLNHLIGYELPIATPPTELALNSNEQFEWYLDNNFVVDLSAWVGQVKSGAIEFTVPDRIR